MQLFLRSVGIDMEEVNYIFKIDVLTNARTEGQRCY